MDKTEQSLEGNGNPNPAMKSCITLATKYYYVVQ